ncbi:ROK family protein [Elizabethkingia sp. JS20170427COW]|uniref:ROK family protein n=1 Tax=Elizabethkingia sp. JS20170427COW TaxID=2583851 RepID=UPI001110A9AE|nr:ROK family protein [Elizabethkingia sp. JS20170427COW]QCX53534.1 ROK family protein [Elizabethkingia sp. JS20170427COW]
MRHNIIGIDVGGSHITLSQVDTEKKELISSSYVREHIDSFGKKEQIFEDWVAAINKAIEGLEKETLLLGIAMPGPFDYENGISLMLQGKFMDIYQVNIKEVLAERLSLSQDQIYFVNDAAAFLEGELYGGCVQGYKRVFGITLGTGLGTTFFKGEFSTDEDLWNSPFRDSICEDYLATRWFVKRYKQLTGETITGTKDLYEKPQELQAQMFEEYAESLGEFIVKYVKYYDPEAIVLGGNITKAYPLYQEKLQEYLEENDIHVKIEISKIFEDAAILGAASFAIKSQ